MRDEEIYALLGRAIAERRAKSRLTQKQLAEMVGVSRASIANAERGKQTISVHNLYAIAAALEVQSLADLLPPLRSIGPNRVEVTSQDPIYASELESVQRLIDSISKAEGAKVRK